MPVEQEHDQIHMKFDDDAYDSDKLLAYSNEDDDDESLMGKKKKYSDDNEDESDEDDDFATNVGQKRTNPYVENGSSQEASYNKKRRFN